LSAQAQILRVWRQLAGTQFVKQFMKTNKNNVANTESICEVRAIQADIPEGL